MSTVGSAIQIGTFRLSKLLASLFFSFLSVHTGLLVVLDDFLLRVTAYDGHNEHCEENDGKQVLFLHGIGRRELGHPVRTGRPKYRSKLVREVRLRRSA